MSTKLSNGFLLRFLYQAFPLWTSPLVIKLQITNEKCKIFFHYQIQIKMAVWKMEFENGNYLPVIMDTCPEGKEFKTECIFTHQNAYSPFQSWSEGCNKCLHFLKKCKGLLSDHIWPRMFPPFISWKMIFFHLFSVCYFSWCVLARSWFWWIQMSFL